MSNETVSGLKLRPLISRQFSTNACTFSTTPTHFFNLHNPKLAPWTNQPLSDYGGKREMSRGAPLVSSRWNPTPEQVQALEEMYRRGTRTPTAEQIQHIVGKLRRFGKIEGKNVFYWFQNHKARDRQKKRRQLELLAAKDLPRNQLRKQSGLRRKYLESDQPAMSRCSTVSQYAKGEVEECKRDRWAQLDLQQQSVTAANSTMQLDMSSCMSPNVSIHKLAPGQENSHPFTALSKLSTRKNDDSGKLKRGIGENRTLELFPVRSSGLSLSNLICSSNEEMNDVSSTVTTPVRPNQFFEFLPIKD